jgi:hypothetical protein
MELHTELAYDLLFSEKMKGVEMESMISLEYLLKSKHREGRHPERVHRFASKYIGTEDRIGISRFNKQFSVTKIGRQNFISYMNDMITRVETEEHLRDIDSNKIKVGLFDGDFDNSYPEELQLIGRIMKDSDTTGVPSPWHSKILPQIFKKYRKNIFSMEVPLFFIHDPSTGKKKLITGKIDLLGMSNGKLLILDFKPKSGYKSDTEESLKKHLFQTIPQLALYGLVSQWLMHLTRMPIWCISYNQRAALIFKPEILYAIYDHWDPNQHLGLLGEWQPFLEPLLPSVLANTHPYLDWGI